ILIVGRVTSGVIWAIVALIVLNIWGVQIFGLWTTFVSVAALIGVGFLASWSLISSIAASFLISIWRPFQLGETVELVPENLGGRVVDRDLMYTMLREKSGSVIKIPNFIFFQRQFRVSGANEKTTFELLEASSTPAQNPSPSPHADLPPT